MPPSPTGRDPERNGGGASAPAESNRHADAASDEAVQERREIPWGKIGMIVGILVALVGAAGALDQAISARESADAAVEAVEEMKIDHARQAAVDVRNDLDMALLRSYEALGSMEGTHAARLDAARQEAYRHLMDGRESFGAHQYAEAKDSFGQGLNVIENACVPLAVVCSVSPEG